MRIVDKSTASVGSARPAVQLDRSAPPGLYLQALLEMEYDQSGENHGEADLSASQPEATQQARFSCAHAHARGSPGPEPPAAEGSQPAHREDWIQVAPGRQ